MPKPNELQKPPINLVTEIGFLPEWVLDEILDPLSTLSPGQAARLGAALSVLGNHLSNNAKDAVFGSKAREDSGVTFDTVEATSFPALNNQTVQNTYPRTQYPKLYRTQKRKSHVLVDLPFDTKQILQLAA